MRLSRWINGNIKRVGGDLGIWLRLSRWISDGIKRNEEDIRSDPRRSSPDMGIYGKQPGSVDVRRGFVTQENPSDRSRHRRYCGALGAIIRGLYIEA